MTNSAPTGLLARAVANVAWALVLLAQAYSVGVMAQVEPGAEVLAEKHAEAGSGSLITRLSRCPIAFNELPENQTVPSTARKRSWSKGIPSLLPIIRTFTFLKPRCSKLAMLALIC